jgi:hypothetical protein
MKPCIVSFSSVGRENYNKAMFSLIRSVRDVASDSIDMMMYSFDGYTDEYLGQKIELGNKMNYPQPKAWQCFNNAEIPYQFKLAMIQRAREAGYTQIIWCDSTVRMSRDISPILEKANKQGVCVFDNLGHPLWNWISDIACERLNIDVETLKTCPQIMACVIAFDFSNPLGSTIFDAWVKFSQDGVSFHNYKSTREGFVAHRHDQAVLSYLVHKMGIPFEPYGTMVYKLHAQNKEYGDKYMFINWGVE